MGHIKTRRFVSALFVVAIVAHLASSAHATHPDIQRPYRFLPRHSTLHETHPNLETPDREYHIYGTFDLVIGHDRDDPSIHNAAWFTNVRAWFQNPLSLAPPRPLDPVLNLSGLKGRPLPVASIFDVYKFEGTTASGSDVDLFASLIGPWIYLRGGTTPPPDHPDFVYTIQAIARTRPFTDFNDDGVVDHADLDVWSHYLGASPSVADAVHLGDADGNHFITGGDFLAWQQHAGETPPSVESFEAAIAASLASAGIVPEPASTALVVACAILFAARSATNRRPDRLRA
jgi:hypothetical protein